MQPQEPVTGSVPPTQRAPESVPGEGVSAASPAEAAKDAKRKGPRRRVRFWVAMVVGVVALLGLGGVGVAVLLYDKETKIDRASPDQVTSSFLRSYLGDRNDAQAKLFICGTGASLDAIAGLRNEMIAREESRGTTVTVTWESLTVSGTTAGRRSVAVDLFIAGSANGKQLSGRAEPWTFDLVDEDGWRVCGATKS